MIFLTIVLVLAISYNIFYTGDDVLIEEAGEPVKDEDLQADEETLAIDSSRPEKGISVYIGMPVQNLTDQFGEPDRKDYSYYDYEIYVYENPSTYMLVGVRDNKVTMISAVGEELDISPFEFGEKLETVYKEFMMRPEVEFAFEDGVYRFELFEDDLNIRPLIPLGDIFAQLYFDNFTGELLIARFIDVKTLLLHQPYDMSYRGKLIEPDPLTEERWELADETSEKEIFELTNIVRQKHSLPPLIWDEETSGVAYRHSMDMSETESFSHVSEKSGDLADRLEANDVFYELAGENIAYQYTDSIAVVAGWLNSKGHRETLLNEDFTHLGVGVYRKYYTQNFLKKSWGQGADQ